MISAPVIREPITGGRGQISGNFTAQSATDLALLLRAGALPAPLTVVEENTIGPELGADAIRAGAISLGVGFVLVIAFMGSFYGLFGWFANVVLVVNLVLMLAILSVLQATLTLPGMAGILLTLGHGGGRQHPDQRAHPRGAEARAAAARGAGARLPARLSNDLRFERHGIPGPCHAVHLRHRPGARLRGDDHGRHRHQPVHCLDADTSVRLPLVYFQAATPASGLNAMFLRPMFRLVPDGTRIRFMNGRFMGLLISAVLSTASVILFIHPGLHLGIDFAGGVVMEVRTPGPADFGKIRAALAAEHVNEQGVQRFGQPDQVLIRIGSRPTAQQTQDDIAHVKVALDKAEPGSKVLSTQAIGASVSAELFRNGLLALALSLLMILVYIWFRFEWQFAVGAVVTLVLDITKTIGFLAITRFDFDLVMVAAILTVLGYSTNDKVVVYDRVRENLRKYKTMPLRDLIDLSINETLNRTVGTSMTVFLAALPLALFGGQSISGFAWVMLFGIVVGTSSSIGIAAPILLLLGENRLRREAAAPVGAPKVRATPPVRP